MVNGIKGGKAPQSVAKSPSPFERLFLLLVSRNAGQRLVRADFADHLGVTPNHVSKTIAELVQKNWLIKTPDSGHTFRLSLADVDPRWTSLELRK
tara:strand:- start:1183 stop:1467 length:285 start_codon:yes stop_codon:yes gene_type:complete